MASSRDYGLATVTSRVRHLHFLHQRLMLIVSFNSGSRPVRHQRPFHTSPEPATRNHLQRMVRCEGQDTQNPRPALSATRDLDRGSSLRIPCPAQC